MLEQLEPSPPDLEPAAFEFDLEEQQHRHVYTCVRTYIYIYTHTRKCLCAEQFTHVHWSQGLFSRPFRKRGFFSTSPVPRPST